MDLTMDIIRGKSQKADGRKRLSDLLPVFQDYIKLNYKKWNQKIRTKEQHSVYQCKMLALFSGRSEMESINTMVCRQSANGIYTENRKLTLTPP